MIRVYTPRPLARPYEKQIEMYLNWKGIRHPYAVKWHGEVLRELFSGCRVNCCTEITDERLDKYLSTLNGQFFKNQTINVYRQFMRYWMKMGVLSRQIAPSINRSILGETNMHTEKVVRVQQMRSDGVPFRQIKLRMESEDGRKYDLHQLHRWAKYELSTGPHNRR
jgi:hypothetical protein